MARYGSEHKAQTRARILERAGERFKREGVAGAGVARLMADAGLTNGAFYAHFESKEALLTEVVAAQLDSIRDRFADTPDDPSGVEAQVRRYLSPEHRDDPARGCPTAALVEDLARAGTATRTAFTDGLRGSLVGLAAHFPDATAAEANLHALGVFSILVGTLQIARAVADPELSDAILEEGVENALASLRRGQATSGG